MIKPSNDEIVINGIKCGKIDAACRRYSLGRNSMRKISKEAGAVVRYGRCYLINFTIMDQYIDDITR